MPTLSRAKRERPKSGLLRTMKALGDYPHDERLLWHVSGGRLTLPWKTHSQFTR
jgi:hypothetical protein